MCLSASAYSAESEVITIPDNPKWKEECASCHVAYPPQLMSGAGWQRLMGELGKHFGVDASLDAKDNEVILNLLLDNAGTAWGGKTSESGLRVSDTQWFFRKHRKVSNRVWSDPLVKSPSNCTACHVEAERGDWGASSIHIPMPGSKISGPESGVNKKE
jgi:hypothetical protein